MTEDEERNGWTEEKLAKYLAERNLMQSAKINIHNRRKRPASQNHSYSVLHWRK